jgi:hypothetical protein
MWGLYLPYETSVNIGNEPMEVSGLLSIIYICSIWILSLLLIIFESDLLFSSKMNSMSRSYLQPFLFRDYHFPNELKPDLKKKYNFKKKIRFFSIGTKYLKYIFASNFQGNTVCKLIYREQQSRSPFATHNKNLENLSLVFSKN